jgi:TRAP-type C4-dicarboxylate transport system substrate-binding protein
LPLLRERRYLGPFELGGGYHYHRTITLTGHIFGAAVPLCHAPTYRGWPAEIREAVHDATGEATATQRALAAAEYREVLAKLEPDSIDVVRLTAAQRAAFAAEVAPATAEMRGRLGLTLLESLGET